MAKQSMRLELEVLPQPDNLTCGPTCLHAVYRYWGLDVPLADVIAGVPPLPEGGTLAVTLACHALRRGFRAEIFTYNVQIFDPTWFAPGVDLAQRLQAQRKHKRDRKLGLATDAYLEYLTLGGTLHYEDLTGRFLRRFLDRGKPVLTGLSATYLYGCARERDDGYDDAAGQPAGHFVVLCGYDRAKREVQVADPMRDNPRFRGHNYGVAMDRLIASILLGIVTYDANLLVLTPAGGK
jgi:hypothetical protein